MAEEATAAYEGCRTRVAAFLGVRAAQDVVITRGTTAAINLMARGIEDRLEPGDEIVVTVMEHHANLLPWQGLARRRGLQCGSCRSSETAAWTKRPGWPPWARGPASRP
ncbi:MAG: aminotransferase class V-fold PLP-dependent enzyme [Pseudomonadota bacterium]